MTTKLSSIAVLIDADNASAKYIGQILQEIETLGHIRCKKIYGDWGNAHIQGWQEALLKYAINPMQQFAYVKGKNATDIGMVIEAMDLLHSGNYDGFCLVSSDSDFTSLALRIRKSNVKVFGFGRRNTVSAFTQACDQFFFVEDLITMPTKSAAPEPANTAAPSTSITPWKTKQLHTQTHLIGALNKLIKENPKSDDGWTNLSYLASQLNQNHSSIDLDKYGYKKFSDLITALRLYDMRRDNSVLFIKLKKKKPILAVTKSTDNSTAVPSIANDFSTNKAVPETASSYFSTATSIDIQIITAPSVDAVLFRVNDKTRVRGDEDMIFYGQTHSEDGSIKLDQQLEENKSVSYFSCNLGSQPTAITQFIFALASEVDSINTDLKQTAVTLNITDSVQQTTLFSGDFDVRQKTGESLLLFTLSRDGKHWRFKPLHQSIDGDLRGLCQKYGVELSDD
jgi:stress response protein SCP2/uncharacterized LabA/DUF88 family protein